MLWRALAAWVCGPGGLVLAVDEMFTPHVCFAAKCLRIPYTKVLGMVILGTSNRIGYSGMGESSWSVVRSGPEEVAAHLDSHSYAFLDRDAIIRVSQAIVDGARSKLTKQEKVHLALRQIGRSAHYSEVAQVYDEMYPEDEMSKHNVHAILSRCASPELELYGIVYVGTKGTYGLKEHGYTRPGMRLFDTIAKIVKERHQTTQKPVHINTIVGGVG